MKICFVVGTFPSLSETFILNQITGLLDQGHYLRIYAGARSSDLIVHEDVIRSGLLSHVRFFNEMPKFWLARILRFLVLFLVTLLQAPVPALRSLNIRRYGQEALSLRLFFRMQSFLAIRDHDIVYCHSWQDMLTVIQMKEIGAITGRLVSALRGDDIPLGGDGKVLKVSSKIFSRVSLFLPASRFSEERLLESGCPAKKIRVHRAGVDLSCFGGATRKRFGTVPLRILSVACLVEKKGIACALEAVGKLVRDGIVCEYTIIGDGPLRDQLRVLAGREKILDCVRFAGWQDSGSIHRYLKDADLFLAPGLLSLNDDEDGIPVVLMEAMASGVPVVTTRSGGIRELVEDRKTGFLVNSSDPLALRDGLRLVWQNPALAQTVAAQAREIIERQYNMRKLNEELINLLMAVAYEKYEE
jgi:colanic acid/amylovoran biosynthesis glycosyltransferase